MTKPVIASAEDIENFFNAFNSRNWKVVLNYMSSDCIWDATEQFLKGSHNILDYWTNYHAAFRETLGKPEKVLFGDHMVYLQVKIHLEFIKDSFSYGKFYKKGMTLDFTCADFYELNDEGKIKAGRVYTNIKPSGFDKNTVISVHGV